MSALSPILCGGCGAPAPLVDAPEQVCRFCRQAVPTPPSYLQAVVMQRDAVAARRAAEPHWQRLSAGSSPWWRRLGGATMMLAPPVLTGVGLAQGLATASVFALFTLPSLFPGGVLFVWGATADVSRRGMAGALAARPATAPGALPSCRVCGAPLAVHAGELSSTCLYCGTDSLVAELPLGAISSERREAQSSLQQGIRALRRRIWSVRLALCGLATLLVGLSWAMYEAQQRLQ